jgi:peptidoglycan/LPS O-acetylase OafA/YrhL
VTLGELILNVAVLFIVLFRNVGVHDVTRRRFTVPVVIIAAVGLVFLRHVPTQGNDGSFEVLGLAAGILLGVAAGALLRLERNRSGRLQTRAGAAFAGLWIVIIAGRVAFSEGATHTSTPGRSPTGHGRTRSPDQTPSRRCSSSWPWP